MVTRGMVAERGCDRTRDLARLMVVYFTPWYLVIGAINAALIVGIVWLAWPTKTMVGA